MLKIKEWRDNPNDNQTVEKIEEGEKNDHQTGGFEEDIFLPAVLDTEGAEADKSKHRQRAESKSQHGQSTVPKTSGRQPVDLHRLGESAGQEKGGDTDQKRRQGMSQLGGTKRMLREELRHRRLKFLAHGKTSRRLIPRMSMTRATIKLSMKVASVFRVKLAPMAPITPPNGKKRRFSLREKGAAVSSCRLPWQTSPTETEQVHRPPPYRSKVKR